jgi:hypothetical protein
MDTRTGWWFRLAISSSVRQNSVILVGALFLSLVSSFPSLLDEEEELKDGGRLPLLSRMPLLVVVSIVFVVLASSSSIT